MAAVGSGDLATVDSGVLPVAPGGDAEEIAPPPSVEGPLATAPTGAARPWWQNLSVNPRKIWFMVILISGISFAGYVLGKVLGTDRGLLLTAAVGGLVSSTAVSLSYAQRSKEAPALSRQFAIGILLANSIMPLRLLLVTVVIAPALLKVLTIPMLAMVLVAGMIEGVGQRSSARRAEMEKARRDYIDAIERTNQIARERYFGPGPGGAPVGPA